MDLLVWVGIIFCVSQSAMFSGLNLALFSITRLRLEVEAAGGDRNAERILIARQDSNFLLTTVLWGNVGINVLLTLLSKSVMAGVAAFFFSTFVITFIGEILPQAYFSRNAIRMGSLLLPVLKFYQFLLYPAAKPSAKILDWWIGPEGIQYFREKSLRALIKKHIESEDADIDRIEGVGALNFLAIDDVLISKEGEPVDILSIIEMPVVDGAIKFPDFERSAQDPFMMKVQASGRKWVILVDDKGEPVYVLDADAFLRDALFEERGFIPFRYCHRPVVVRDPKQRIGNVISKLRVESRLAGDDVIEKDIILLWGDSPRIITGADLLGRLLRGITFRKGQS
ncbi:MAG: DUF21 domain-containing protein [Nitrospirota bacterium]|nr:MAG: DUF21 domain-containing protein [Nitrospirota bacterium]